MKNIEIRSSAKDKGVRMWQIADALHIRDSALSRKLRYELPQEEKKIILGVIEKLAREGT